MLMRIDGSDSDNSISILSNFQDDRYTKNEHERDRTDTIVAPAAVSNLNRNIS